MEWTKKIRGWGHRVCLGDNAQNITKMDVFCSFSGGILGEFCNSCLRQMKQISKIFPIYNFTNCQLNCIIFVKDQWNLFKIIILPSYAKQWNDLNIFDFLSSIVWDYSFQSAHTLSIYGDFRCDFFVKNIVPISLWNLNMFKTSAISRWCGFAKSQ